MKGNINMAFMNKIVGSGAHLAERLEPTFRFGGGIHLMGAVTREADTRTTKQLLANIDYFAEKLPEVAQFKKELKAMNPEHLGLVSDICELGSYRSMLPTNIDIRKPASNGKSLLTFLMEKLPWASKENPEMLEFSKEVINHTDITASKYFLGSFAGLFEHPEAGRHLAATKPLVKDIAEAALRGGYTMDYSKEQKFVNVLGSYVNPAVNPEKIEIVNEALRTVEKLPDSVDLSCYVDGATILKSETPVSQMRENLRTFEQIAEGLSQKTKEVNLTEFVTRNVNLD